MHGKKQSNSQTCQQKDTIAHLFIDKQTNGLMKKRKHEDSQKIRRLSTTSVKKKTIKNKNQ